MTTGTYIKKISFKSSSIAKIMKKISLEQKIIENISIRNVRIIIRMHGANVRQNITYNNVH